MGGLPKDKLIIPLGLGIQTDVDDKLLPVGKAVELENGTWQRSGEIVKRPGGSLLGTGFVTTLTPGTMPKPWQLATHKGDPVSLSQAGVRPIGIYSPAIDKWVPPTLSAADATNGVASRLRGQLLPQRTPVLRSNSHGPLTAAVTSTDVATNGTYALVAQVIDDSVAATASVQAQVLELSTGKVLFEFTATSAVSTSAVRVAFAVDRFLLAWTDGANIHTSTLFVSAITSGAASFSSPDTVVTDNTVPALHMIASGTDFLIAYFAGAQTHMIRRTPSATTTVQILDGSGASIPAGTALSWMADLASSGKLALNVSSAAQGVRVHWDISSLGVTTTTYTINGTAVASRTIVGFTISAAATGEFFVLYTANASTTDPTVLGRRTVAGGVYWQNWYANDFAVGPFSVGPAVIASQPFLHGTDVYVVLEYVSPEQGTYFAVRVPVTTATPIGAIDMNRTPSAKFCAGQAAVPSSPNRTPPSVLALSADVVLTSMIVATRFVPVATAQTFDKGVDMVTLTFNPATGRTVEFADSLYVTGGILGAFDGRTFAEEGFHLFPEPAKLVQQASGSLTLLGTYEYIWVWRYSDAYGRLRRSTPSEPEEVTLTGANRGVVVTGKSCKFHGRPGQVVAELYRNTNGQNDRHTLIAVVTNDELIDTVTFTDTLSDAAIATGEELYTDGEVLPSEPPPSALAVGTYKDRLAVISGEDPTLVWVSLPLVEGQGPRFNSESTFRIDDAHGNANALGAVDDRLLVFKQSAIYTVTGDGPDVLGNGSFGLATYVANGIGCLEPRSVVQMPDGVAFWSNIERERIQMVDRGLTVQYIGAPVQAYNALTIVDAIYTAGAGATTEGLAEFFTTAGRTLVYDHQQKLWSTYTGQAAAAACTWAGRHLYQQAAISTLSLVAEDTTGAVWTEAGADPPYDVIVTTPWISLAQLKGYARIYRIQGVGTTVGAHVLRLYLYADFDATTPVSETALVIGASTNWNLWELRYSSKKSAFKIKIRITTAFAANPTAGAKLSALTLQYGIKSGLRPTAYTNRLT